MNWRAEGRTIVCCLDAREDAGVECTCPDQQSQRTTAQRARPLQDLLHRRALALGELVPGAGVVAVDEVGDVIQSLRCIAAAAVHALAGQAHHCPPQRGRSAPAPRPRARAAIGGREGPALVRRQTQRYRG